MVIMNKNVNEFKITRLTTTVDLDHNYDDEDDVDDLDCAFPGFQRANFYCGTREQHHGR